jgi:hypothetical protein
VQASPGGGLGTVAVRRLLGWRKAISRVRRTHRRKLGRTPRLFPPRSFTDKIEWRKLFDFNPAYNVLCDKVAVRSYVAERVGDEANVPVLWVGDDPAELPLEALPRPFIVKCSHGSHFNIPVDREGALDPASLRQKLEDWLSIDFGLDRHEPGYIGIPRRLLVEPILSDKGRFIPEYKFFTFDGKVRAVLVQTRRGWDMTDLIFDYYDADWRRMPNVSTYPSKPHDDPPPAQFELMREWAEALGRGFDHLRVDFLVSDGRLYVGEVTAYHLSGHWKFDRLDYDRVFGDWWQLNQPVRRAIRTIFTREWGAVSLQK